MHRNLSDSLAASSCLARLAPLNYGLIKKREGRARGLWVFWLSAGRAAGRFCVCVRASGRRVGASEFLL